MISKRHILQFPGNINITVLPVESGIVNDDKLAEFRKMIAEAFKEYTKGTKTEYIMQDKLSFIGWIRKLNFSVTGDEIVTEQIRLEFDENGIVEAGNIFDADRVEAMIDEAVYRYRRDWHHWSGDHHIDEPACILVGEAIKAVMDYMPDKEVFK